MRGHILDLSNDALELHVKHEQLLINKEGAQIYSVPMEDIAVILLAHPRIKASAHFFQKAMEHRVAVVVCDPRYVPVGMTLPISGHHLSAERLDMQIRIDLPTKKRVWRQLVRSKINFQAFVLKTLFGDAEGLKELAKEVKSGDSDNREGVAAKKYWARLFQGLNFKRDYEGADPINAALNYGYGIVRAIVARAIVGTGFNPTLGVHHHNRYNAFALADDLMEPLRPVVDICVFRMLEENLLTPAGLTHEIKTRIVNQINSHERYLVNGKQERIFETAALMAESLVRVYAGDSNELRLPDTLPLTTVEYKGSALKTGTKKPKGKGLDTSQETTRKPIHDPFQEPVESPRSVSNTTFEHDSEQEVIIPSQPSEDNLEPDPTPESKSTPDPQPDFESPFEQEDWRYDEMSLEIPLDESEWETHNEMDKELSEGDLDLPPDDL